MSDEGSYPTDEVVWFVDPETFAVAWGNDEFEAALQERGIALKHQLPLDRLFADAETAEAWRTLYQDALFVSRLVSRLPFLDGDTIDVELITVRWRGKVAGIAVFGARDIACCAHASVSAWPTTSS